MHSGIWGLEYAFWDIIVTFIEIMILSGHDLCEMKFLIITNQQNEWVK